MMDDAVNSHDQEQLSMRLQESLVDSSPIDSPIFDLPDDAGLFPEALLGSSDASSCSPRDTGEGEPSFFSSFYHYIDDASNFSTSHPDSDEVVAAGGFSMEEPPEEQTDNMMAVAAAAAPLPWPAQSLLQPVYDDEGLLPPAMDPVMGQLLMDAGMGRFYQGGIGLPQYGAGTGSGERQGFFGGGTPAMVLPDMDYRSIGMGVYDMDSFQHNGYSASHNQVMGDIPLQQQQQQKQQEISLAGAPMASDISSLEDSTFKVGRISAEERKEKIHRYIKKRNERNFSKKIKYACRKTLADSRPRVRGRFAKNDDFGEVSRPSTSNHDYDDDEKVQGNEEDLVDSRILAHISGINSFKYNYPIESWI